MIRTPRYTRRKKRRPVALLLLCGGVASTAACATPRMGAVAVEDAKQKELNEWGHGAFDQADYVRAVDLFTESLSRAQLRDDAEAIRDAAFNLAASLGRIRRYADAREVLRRAHVATVASRAELNADCMLLDGYLAYKLGKMDEARRITRVGLSQPGELHEAFYILEACIGCAEGDAAAAKASLGKAPIVSNDIRLDAERARINGEIAVLEGRHEQATPAFDRAADLYRQVGHYVGMAESLAAAARAYEAAGNRAGAANRWFRAGRSAKLQQFPEADEWLRRAVQSAEAVNDEPIAAEAATWLEAPPGE